MFDQMSFRGGGSTFQRKTSMHEMAPSKLANTSRARSTQRSQYPPHPLPRQETKTNFADPYDPNAKWDRLARPKTSYSKYHNDPTFSRGIQAIQAPFKYDLKDIVNNCSNANAI